MSLDVRRDGPGQAGPFKLMQKHELSNDWQSSFYISKFCEHQSFQKPQTRVDNSAGDVSRFMTVGLRSVI